MNKKKTTIVLAAIYAAMVAWIILFKMATISELAEMDRTRSINLIPFHYAIEQTYHKSEVLNNVAIFVPIGIYLKMLNFKNVKVILCGAVFSLGLELLQFIFGIGATDITDLITNTSGAAIGVLIYDILSLGFKEKEKQNKMLNIVAAVCTVLFLAFVALLIIVN